MAIDDDAAAGRSRRPLRVWGPWIPIPRFKSPPIEIGGYNGTKSAFADSGGTDRCGSGRCQAAERLERAGSEDGEPWMARIDRRERSTKPGAPLGGEGRPRGGEVGVVVAPAGEGLVEQDHLGGVEGDALRRAHLHERARAGDGGRLPEAPLRAVALVEEEFEVAGFSGRTPA